MDCPVREETGIRRRAWLILACLTLFASCGDPRLAQIPEDADEYIVGIQYEDYRGLVKRLGAFRAALAETPAEEWDALREKHEEQVIARYADYEQAKKSGRFSLEDDGIALLQALAVGKGVYYRFHEILPDESGDTVTAHMEVKLDYTPQKFRSLPAGTKVFVMTEPPGSIHVVTVGEPVPEELRVVGALDLEWRLRWYEAVDVYPEGWAVESIRIRPETLQLISWSSGP